MYTGKKFFPDDNKTTISYDIWGNEVVKQGFSMTRSYARYLREKREQEERREIQKLKEKLDYEYTTTGEVDELDYYRYMKLVKESY